MGKNTGLSVERRAYPGNPTTLVENVPDPTPALKATLEAYNNVRWASFSDFLADGSMLVYRRVLAPGVGENAVQVHNLTAPLTDPVKLTHEHEPQGGADGRPGHADQFLISMDQGGNEKNQIYIVDTHDGVPKPLSEPGTKNVGEFWSKDGKEVVWSSVPINGKDYDIVIADVDSGTRRTVYKGTGRIFAEAYDAVNGKIIVGESLSNVESRLYLLDLKTGKKTQINAAAKPTSYGGAQFVDNGRAIITTSNEYSEFKNLVKIDLKTGQQTFLSNHVPWDVESWALSPDGTKLAYSVNANGASELRIRDLKANTELRPAMPSGVLSSLTFDDSGKKLGFNFNAADRGNQPQTYDLATQTFQPWVDVEYAGLDPESFVAPELISYKSFDGLEIPAYVYRPKNQTEKGPVIIEIHGGPEAQSRPYFSRDMQIWVKELGATVIVPNVRGSTGYGKTYVDLDNGFNRKDSVKDIGALLDWIEKDPKLDKDRVAVHGASYGGYMVLATLEDYEDRLAGGVDGVGISHFGTFLANTAADRRAIRAAEYGDPAIPGMKDFHDEISPLNNATKIKDPLFVVQGQNDERVPMSEAEQIVKAVRANGQDAWYMLGTNEGHGFARRENAIAEREATIQFFRKIFGLEKQP